MPSFTEKRCSVLAFFFAISHASRGDTDAHKRHKEHPASHSLRGTLNTIIRVNSFNRIQRAAPRLRGVSQQRAAYRPHAARRLSSMCARCC